MPVPRRHIVPDRDLEEILLNVDTPSRYTGGEYKCTVRPDDDLYTVALCFPDLYEIGMSNTAIKILYTLINATPGVRCERVFAPAVDFEEALHRQGVPLYTLESGIPLCDCDMVAFSMGYELSATNILAVLSSGGIPIDFDERGEGDPLIIAGGPAVTNPVPYGAFLDAVIIGEAEACLQELLSDLAETARRGESRTAMLDVLREHRSVWAAGKAERVERAVWEDFGRDPFLVQFPLPHLRPVQDHGVIEIMRGCPNGCRFCHAGIYYRPYRMKELDAIISEADHLILRYGYRDITLSSLSSGDYSEIASLMQILNRRYRGLNVSFSLPSLKVDSFTLPILEQLSEVRRSGLTFAVETPWEDGQVALNKSVSYEQIVDILKTARSHGFRSAKFYFMIGLPLEQREPEAEAEAIVTFVRNVFGATGVHIHLNIGTFVPKPHTPFQWVRQLSEAESRERIAAIRAKLRRYGFVKLGWASPFHSFIEGIISRGDERAGALVKEAFLRGARFDAWEDRTRRDAWEEAIDAAGWPVEAATVAERPTGERLPWSAIRLGVPDAVLFRELERSRRAELTTICAPECVEPCGVCNRRLQPRPASAAGEPQQFSGSILDHTPASDDGARLLFRYQKRGPARFLPHRSVVIAFERAFQMCSVPVTFSAGFNPHPVVELSPPLPLGAAGLGEAGRVDVNKKIHVENLPTELSARLPDGLVVDRVELLSLFDRGRKRPTIGALLWGGRYELV
ncbi:TIGR03936 family radical SAM-associated protein, partial [Salinispira pacifica]